MPVLVRAALAVVALLVLGVPRSALADSFVRVTGEQFTVDGTVYKIKGANYYPGSAPWGEWFSEWPWDEMVRDIDMMYALGINALRLNLPYSVGGWGGANVNPLYLERLERLVELLRSRGMRANITLFDWETSFPAAGTDTEAQHKQYVTAIVNLLKNNPGVFLWDVKNEPDHPNNIGGYDNWDYSPASRDKIVSWLYRMCQHVRALDPNQPVSCGIRWWENVADVVAFEDVAIFHSYWPTIDTQAIPAVKSYTAGSPKPILVQEFGWPSHPTPTFSEAAQLDVFATQISAFGHHDIAGGIQWQARDLDYYPNATSFENYFGLWTMDNVLKPAGAYYRDNWPWPVQRFPISDSTIPAAPTNVTAVGGDRAVTLAWTNSASIDCAGVVIRSSTVDFPATAVDGSPVCNIDAEPKSNGWFTHAGLAPGTTYYYSLFARDFAGNYSPRATASAATDYQPANLLSGHEIDSFAGGTAVGWSSYERYPVGNEGPISFSADRVVYETGGASQRINGFSTSALPNVPGSFAHAGIVQTVPATPGDAYLLIGKESLTCGADAPRYFRTFGLDPSGSIDPGPPTASNVGTARWLGPSSLVWNTDQAGSNVQGGWYRCLSAAAAESASVSCWAGIGISLVDGRLDSDQINYDDFHLIRVSNPVNQALLNGDMEGSILDYDDGGIRLPWSWAPVGGSCGQFAGYSMNESAAYARSGTRSAMLICTRGVCEHGLMQRVATFSGETLSASIWVRGVALGVATTTASIGIDPTGGADIFSPTVAWATFDVRNRTDWNRISVDATAASSSATVFVRVSSGSDHNGYHTVYADDAAFAARMIVRCPGALKTLPDGRTVWLEDCVVTGVFDGFFYVQDRARTSGIRVISGAAVSVGQVVNVTGAMATREGERIVESASLY